MKRYTIHSPIKYGGKVRKDGVVDLPDDIAADLVASGHVSESTVTATAAAKIAEQARVEAEAAEKERVEAEAAEMARIAAETAAKPKAPAKAKKAK